VADTSLPRFGARCVFAMLPKALTHVSNRRAHGQKQMFLGCVFLSFILYTISGLNRWQLPNIQKRTPATGQVAIESH